MVSRKQIKKLINKAQNESLEHYYPSEKENLYAEAFRLAKEIGDNKLKKEILWEIDLLNRTFGHVSEDGTKEISNKWEWIIENKAFGRFFKNEPFCKWDRNALDYYRKQLDEPDLKNPLQKARYAYAIWVFTKDILFAECSMDYFLQTARLYLEEQWYAKSYQIVPFCLRFSLKLTISLRSKKRFLKALDELNYAINKEWSLGEKRWILELVEILAEITNDLKRYRGFKIDNYIFQIVSKNLPKVEELVRFYLDERNYHLARSYIAQLVSIYDFLGNYERKFEYDFKFAHCFEEEGDRREEPMAKANFYLNAINHYILLQSRYPEKRASLESRINNVKEKHRSAEAEAEYKEIRTKIEITKEQMDALINTLRATNAEEVVWNIVRSPFLIPRYEQTKEFVAQLKGKYPLQFLFPIYLTDKEITIASYTTESEIFDYKVREQYRLAIKLAQILVQNIFRGLHDELTLANVISFLEKNNINIPKANFELVKIGLQKHFAEDYVSSIHIFVPQIERIIAQIFEKKGYSGVTLVKEQTGFRHKELGGLLGEESAIDVLGRDLCESLRIMFTYKDAENIRNRVCHGLMEVKEFDEGTSALLLYFILKLSVFE